MSTDSRSILQPIAESDNSGSTEHQTASRREGNAAEEPINILLVDDEAKNLSVLESVLDNPGYRLVRAESADQALMALIVEDFALLVLDIQMPGMNGFELAQLIKQRKRTASVPIIFLTAYYSEDSHVLEGYSTGAVDYLHKPINPTILRSKVAVFAELFRKTREASVANRALLAEVAERRRAQEELRTLAHDLEQRVALRTNELLNANAALRASEERFQLALKNSRILVYTTDRELRYTWISDRESTGPLIPILGRRDDELLPPDQARPLMELKARVLEAGLGERAGLSFQVGGRRLDYDLTVEPLLDERGDLVGTIVAAMEITDLKEAEAALKEADRRKDEFLATLAHELRNPLAPIRNAVEVLRLTQDDPEGAEEAVQVIDRQSQQLTRLVDDLLEISRITTGKLALRMQPVKLAEAVQGAIETSGPLIEECGHELKWTLPPEDLILNADLTRLSQVFSNLLNNAAKYTPPGGIITLSAQRDGNDVCVSVRDNGRGIPTEMLPHIFEMFTQVDHYLDRTQGGLGIGLHLVQRLVDMHGGTIVASSAGADQGSEFVVRLPLLTGVLPRPAAPPVGDETLATRLRILVVDDNKDNVVSLRMLLSLMGHEVCTACDGLDGIKAADEFRPDVVLLDIGMPTLDGHAACRRIRSYEWGRQMVLVAQTGWGQDDDRRRTSADGFDYHLTKPVSHQALKDLLAEVIDARAIAARPSLS